MPSLSQQFGSSGGTCSLISLATRWSLSQYCDALKSGMRDKTGLVGLCQSLGRIGSQTTKTRSLSVGNCLSKPSIAEAPRTHVGQVGESSTSNRISSSDVLKSLSNLPRVS